MCGGGSMPRSTIVMPDMTAYDRMADRQIAAMRQQQEGQLMLQQQQLNQAVTGQQSVMAELLAVQQQRASNTAADAARMAALIGTPPPEPAAKAPVIGDSRQGMAPPEGKRSLRIDRKQRSSKPGGGAGLNIASY